MSEKRMTRSEAFAALLLMLIAVYGLLVLLEVV
jgi:hypothetical protein